MNCKLRSSFRRPGAAAQGRRGCCCRPWVWGDRRLAARRSTPRSMRSPKRHPPRRL